MRILTIIISCFFFSGNILGQDTLADLKITHLTGDFYVFTTYSYYKGDKIPANGMYLLTGEGAVMFDSPWDTTQFQPLLDSIRLKHNQHVVLCIATHFHEDRTGGLEYYRQQEIKTYTTRQTDELSKKRGMKRAEFLIDKDSVFKVGQYSFQTYYPGHGHAPDNIVIWFEKEKILYGGCLIKSVDDSDLGNLSDANPAAYATTIKNVQQKCHKPAYIITGHNDWINKRSLEHTLDMARKLKQSK
ncbi:BcII family subclass B1 metallo-beta-lactamase [soil metagenome]